MSAIQTRSHVELAARLIDAVGPDRYHRLNGALVQADAEAIGFALRTITAAIDTHERTLDQLRALRDFVQGATASAISAGALAVAPAEQPVSAE